MTATAADMVSMLEGRVDKLTQALLYVASELWVARDRQVVLERVLAESGSDAPALVDAYRPDDALAAKLAAEREAFIASILGYLAPET